MIQQAIEMSKIEEETRKKKEQEEIFGTILKLDSIIDKYSDFQNSSGGANCGQP